MRITWFGHACFLLEGDGVKILTDPFDRSVGYEIPDVTPDVVTESHQHFDHNAHHLIKGDFKVIKTPGVHEFKGVTIKGIETFHDDVGGRSRGKNIVFVFDFKEGIRVAHLGDLGHVLQERHLKEMGEINVLLIPVGGTFTIGPQEAKKVVESVKPDIVIPMHYKTKYITFGILGVDSFTSLFRSYEKVGNSFEVSKENLTGETKVVVMNV